MCGIKSLIHSQTSTVTPLNLRMDNYFHPTLYWTCNYLSILGLNLNHVRKRKKQTSRTNVRHHLGTRQMAIEYYGHLQAKLRSTIWILYIEIEATKQTQQNSGWQQAAAIVMILHIFKISLFSSLPYAWNTLQMQFLWFTIYLQWCSPMPPTKSYTSGRYNRVLKHYPGWPDIYR